MPKQTTGRFDTRKELEEKVIFLYTTTNLSIEQIAKNVKVSAGTATTIIDTYSKVPHE